MSVGVQGPAAATLDCVAAVRERRRVPRRVIHCNDGVIEEYSTDDDEDEVDDAKPPVNPVTLCVVYLLCIVTLSKQ